MTVRALFAALFMRMPPAIPEDRAADDRSFG
jgi:hypothetical protein